MAKEVISMLVNHEAVTVKQEVVGCAMHEVNPFCNNEQLVMYTEGNPYIMSCQCGALYAKVGTRWAMVHDPNITHEGMAFANEVMADEVVTANSKQGTKLQWYYSPYEAVVTAYALTKAGKTVCWYEGAPHEALLYLAACWANL